MMFSFIYVMVNNIMTILSREIVIDQKNIELDSFCIGSLVINRGALLIVIIGV